jgi:hypothetical protein
VNPKIGNTVTESFHLRYFSVFNGQANSAIHFTPVNAVPGLIFGAVEKADEYRPLAAGRYRCYES